MGCATCKCGSGMSNTGADCSPIAKVTKLPIWVPKYASDGTRNSIDLLNDVLNQTYFDNKINAADPADRWYPFPQLENVEDNRGENLIETFASGSTAFVQEGSRQFKGWIVEGANILKGKIEAARCVEGGFFLIDLNGNLIGNLPGDGFLYPIQIDKSSLSAMLVKSTDTTVQKIELKFNFNVAEKDENLNMITCDSLSPVELLNLRGLLDVESTYTDISTTDFTVKLTTGYGDALNPVTVKGLIITDFSLFNVTQNSSIGILSSVESGAPNKRTYLITFAVVDQPSSADEVRLTTVKAGYDFTDVIANLITIP